MKRKDKQKLRLWQERFAAALARYQEERERMTERERLYDGSRTIRPLVASGKITSTPHVRNIVSELIETQVDTNIPQPKVTARRKQDEHLAKTIEDMLRNELDRLSFEIFNDQLSRTVPIQGSAAMLVEWDSRVRTHQTVGELSVQPLHPRMVVPQYGIVNVEDMDWIFFETPQTRSSIKRRYGVELTDEVEESPELRGENAIPSEELCSVRSAYYRNSRGGIGLFTWVGDQILQDTEDYQARRLRRCAKCGALEPPEDVEPLDTPTYDGSLLDIDVTHLGGLPDTLPASSPESPEEKSHSSGGKRVCPYCGASVWEEQEEDFEERMLPARRSDGTEIPGTGAHMEGGVLSPAKIPYYKPDIFPVIIWKNVSVDGKFLGGSDVDRLRDPQNTTNRLNAKICEKLLSAGSCLTLPDDVKIEVNERDMKVIRVTGPQDLSSIHVFTLEGDISQDAAELRQVYEEARQNLGITDSFQGRRDPTATSGKAKEFAAAQSAGRLESKRVMKNAAFAALFEAMFKFKLAYADEPRPVVSRSGQGEVQYETFSRWDFLDRDAAGELYWNDQFLFSVDTTAPLAANRTAMWQETRMNLQSGAFGDPTDLHTLILFWTKMELLHYPGATETKRFLQERLQEQQTAAAMAQQREADAAIAQQEQRMQEAEIPMMPPQASRMP